MRAFSNQNLTPRHPVFLRHDTQQFFSTKSFTLPNKMSTLPCTPCLDIQLSIFTTDNLSNKISYLFYLMHTCVLYIKTHVCNDFIIYK